MKKITIIRHGKSSWNDSCISDEERPLQKKGIVKTDFIAGYLSDSCMIPDIIFSSPAIRAYETAKIVQQKLKIRDEYFYIKDYLYPGEHMEIAHQLSQTDNSINCMMIFGHNPTFTELSNFFLKKEQIEWIPTSGLVHLQFNVNFWSEIMETKADLLDYTTPQSINEQ
ncbi:histidine phosphatase family protein [Desulfobacterales bacterium HSG17]|nr:histidine phosphatase family protein [Desulfobacterales bacterium HSG17]